MKVNSLVKKLSINQTLKNNHEVESIYKNFKEVKEGSIYIAIKGITNDGNHFIEEAINNGAKTIISEYPSKTIHCNINYIIVNNAKKTYALILKILFKDISKKLTLIGITGTNAKTSTTSLISDYLDYNNISNLCIGTHFIKNGKEISKSVNTTPDIKIIYENLLLAKKKKIKYVIMEISSIAVSELRILGLSFDVIGFTNLSVDHLDYHKTIDHYKFSKVLSIFNLKRKGMLFLNKDDESYKLFDSFYLKKPILYSIDDISSDYNLKIETLKVNKSTFKINNIYYESKLFGKYNMYNILLASSILKKLKFKEHTIVEFLKEYKGVLGRNTIIQKHNKTIIVDYAHTKYAVENILKTLKDMNYENLSVVIGCGGNRDKTKRAQIGEVLDKYADKIVLTNDNPRNEDELEIILDIAKGIKNKEYIIEKSRYLAIKNTILESKEKEIVLVLGKGNEDSQEFKDKTVSFNDIEVVNNVLNSLELNIDLSSKVGIYE